MIGWIDGTYGVGKTTVARILEEKINSKVVFIDSDSYYLEFAQKYPYCTMFGGSLPQINKSYLNDFKKYIEQNIDNDMVIVMCLSTIECDEILVKYFKEYTHKHYILCVGKDEFEKRIEVDGSHRDKGTARFYYDTNSKYHDKYSEAIRIETDGISPEEVAQKIISDMLW